MVRLIGSDGAAPQGHPHPDTPRPAKDRMQTRSTLTETRRPGSDDKPFLLVLGSDVFSTYDLPEKGTFVIGRRFDADVSIDDPLLSSDHARLVVDDGYFVEDLGSRNGTFLRQERLLAHARQRIEIGDAVGMGSCLLVVQAAHRSPRSRRIVSYGFFRIRLDEELARAQHDTARRFCIARLQTTSPVPAEVVQKKAVNVLRPFDTLSAFAPDEYAILFSETRAEEGRSLVSELALEIGSAGTGVRSGVARYPEDGRTVQELEAHCLRMLRPGLGTVDLGADIVAESPAMHALYGRAARVAHSTLSVLVTGETGAGKDVLARWIHARSPRSGRPFQAINCAALPEALLEDQLFGHERGAFTGAVRSQKGLVEAAQGGTVFLDEIAEVPLAVQAKLLRLLENNEIQILGAAHAQKVDVRFIAATNEDLVQAAAAKRFRADLLYRLKGVELRVPALRERLEDVLPLARNMLARFARLEQLEAPPVLSPRSESRLLAYPWPGNVRELANVLHRALVLSDGSTIDEDELSLQPHPDAAAGVESNADDGATAATTGKPSRRVVNPSKRQISDALARCGGNQSRAAQALGIPRNRLRDLIAFYELPLPRREPVGR